MNPGLAGICCPHKRSGQRHQELGKRGPGGGEATAEGGGRNDSKQRAGRAVKDRWGERVPKDDPLPLRLPGRKQKSPRRIWNISMGAEGSGEPRSRLPERKGRQWADGFREGGGSGGQRRARSPGADAGSRSNVSSGIRDVPTGLSRCAAVGCGSAGARAGATVAGAGGSVSRNRCPAGRQRSI